MLRKIKKPQIIALFFAVVVSSSLFGCGNSEDSDSNTNEPRTSVTGESLVIPISEVSATAKFYPVTVDGTDLEVIAVQAPDGSIRTAFNTCQVCYSSGNGYYKQEGDELVCQNCGNHFTMDQVAVSHGGCNPVPILDDSKSVTADTITIPYDYLLQSKDLFASWKK
ncbi:hypothetical protein AGMMS50284_3440 [Clostridia bacterium]|nr:hypothetical protein AGMMS50284_3440 [Clostridia bacterium]